MSLSNLVKQGGGVLMPPRLVIIGEKKIGKTTFGASSPSPIILPSEDGCSQLKVDQFDKQTTWDGVLHCITELGKEDHKYKTLVIDTMDGIETLLKHEIIDNHYHGSTDGYNSYGKGELALVKEFKILIDYLDRLRAKKKMHLVILCHVDKRNVSNPMAGDYTQFTGAMGRKVWNLVGDWADQIGYACADEIVVNADDDKDKKGKIRQISDERKLIFGSRSGVDVGTRAGYELPSQISFTYKAYIEAMKAAKKDE